MEDYLVPGGQAQAEYIEKKSRFIGQVFPITTEQEAKATIERVRRQHYDARHNCWCYILKSGQKRYSDDGEPQGTAGQPMLNVFERERVVDVLCVVTRYFGGILLGAGGLCRAYTKAAKDALDAAGICKMQPWLRQTVSAPYALFERVKLLIAAQAGVLEDAQYGADILVTTAFRRVRTKRSARRFVRRRVGRSRRSFWKKFSAPVKHFVQKIQSFDIFL